jgi:hypothetical protein
MGSMSLWHWIIVLLYVAVIGVPGARILAKAGFSRWWTILVFIPVVNLVAFWTFAFMRWPLEGKR